MLTIITIFQNGGSMSHIVSLRTEVRDAVAVEAACRRLNLPPPESGTFELFNARASGYAVRLSGWRFPVVCNLAEGELRLDNYGGHWGDQKELDRFVQAYCVEK